jgi:hypothetical protein
MSSDRKSMTNESDVFIVIVGLGILKNVISNVNCVIIDEKLREEIVIFGQKFDILPKNVGNENKVLKSVQQGEFEVSLEVHNFVTTKNVNVVQLGNT